MKHDHKQHKDKPDPGGMGEVETQPKADGNEFDDAYDHDPRQTVTEDQRQQDIEQGAERVFVFHSVILS